MALGSDNGLSPGRQKAIILTNVGILLIWILGTNFSEILIEIDAFSLNKIRLKMSSGKWRPSCLGLNVLTCLMQHYVTYHFFYYNKITLIDSDNGLPPGWRQAIILTNAGILLIWLLGTNFSDILIKIDAFSLNKIRLKMLSGKWHPSCLSLNALTCLMQHYVIYHCFKTLKPRQNVHQLPDDIFKCISFNENV